MFKRKPAALRAAAASIGVAGLLMAGFAAPAEAASGPHLLTVHVGSGNCPWGYSSVRSVQMAVVPSISHIAYPVAGDHETFSVPGGSWTATIAGYINCGKSWWNWWGPSVTGASVHTQAYYGSATRDVWL